MHPSMFRKSILAAFILALSTFSIAFAEDCPEDAATRRLAEFEKRQQKTRELIERLDISRSQAKKLAALTASAALVHIEAYEQEARLLPQMIDVYAEFAREDRANQGFSQDVEQRTIQLHRREMRVRDTLNEKIIELEEQGEKLLRKAQRNLLEAPLRERREARPPRTDARSRARAAARERERQRIQPLNEARRELLTARGQKHPKPGMLGQYLLHPEGALLLCRAMNLDAPSEVVRAVEVLREGTSEFPAVEVEENREELRELHAEINNWNLINGLHMSERQIEGITKVYDEARRPDWEIKPVDGRTGLARGTDYEAELQIEELLNAGQRQVLAEYNACLIPPKNLTNPVLVGQAVDNSRYARWLDRARKMDDDKLKEQIAAALKRESEHGGEMDKQERRRRYAVMRKTARQAAGMSEAEFEMNKSELADRIAPPNRVQLAKDRVARVSRDLKRPGLITRYMLNAQFMDQLRERGKQLARGFDSEQVDLAQAPQAENCSKGCALNPKGLPSKDEQRTKAD